MRLLGWQVSLTRITWGHANWNLRAPEHLIAHDGCTTGDVRSLACRCQLEPGMASHIFVCQYAPAGNVDAPAYFRANVLPLKSASG